MAELTRVITIEVTAINDPGELLDIEETKARIKEAFADADDVHVRVQDFILEDCND